MWLNIAKNVVKGFVSGFIASALGYAKKEEVPKWDLKKVLQTTLFGGAITAIVYGSGMPLSELSVLIADWIEIPTVTSAMVEFGIITGLVIVVDHIAKIVVRRSEIMKLWNKFKKFIEKYV